MMIIYFMPLKSSAGCHWLIPIIVAIWEAKIRRIMVGGQPGQIVCKTPISKTARAK
jgi:hypothetical protein